MFIGFLLNLKGEFKYSEVLALAHFREESCKFVLVILYDVLDRNEPHRIMDALVYLVKHRTGLSLPTLYVYSLLLLIKVASSGSANFIPSGQSSSSIEL